MTSDGYPAYPEALLAAFGKERVPPRTGKPGRPAGPRVVPPERTGYAATHKTRGGRVVRVETRLVFGAAEAKGSAPRTCLGRQNGADRHRNAPKGRKTCRSSKDRDAREALTAFTMFGSNFCWPVRTLRQRGEGRCRRARAPAMAAGLTGHVWPLEEWLTLPGV